MLLFKALKLLMAAHIWRKIILHLHLLMILVLPARLLDHWLMLRILLMLLSVSSISHREDGLGVVK